MKTVAEITRPERSVRGSAGQHKLSAPPFSASSNEAKMRACYRLQFLPGLSMRLGVCFFPLLRIPACDPSRLGFDLVGNAASLSSRRSEGGCELLRVVLLLGERWTKGASVSSRGNVGYWGCRVCCALCIGRFPVKRRRRRESEVGGRRLLVVVRVDVCESRVRDVRPRILLAVHHHARVWRSECSERRATLGQVDAALSSDP
jgi:hypothetical protein